MSERWKPGRQDEYWWWETDRDVATLYYWYEDEFDIELWDAGNVHPTKEAAEAWGAAQGEKE